MLLFFVDDVTAFLGLASIRICCGQEGREIPMMSALQHAGVEGEQAPLRQRQIL